MAKVPEQIIRLVCRRLIEFSEYETTSLLGKRIFNMEAVRKARQVLGSTHKILIRLKPEMHATLAIRAQKGKRSITEEVHHLLEESLREAK